MNTIVQPTPKFTKPSRAVEASQIADFVIKHGNGLYNALERPLLESVISGHMDYGTLIVVRRNAEIVGAVRWNWADYHTAEILDLVIHKDYRNKDVMKAILIQGWMTNPQLKRLKFHRKKHDRDVTCLVEKFIGGSHGRK